ncbi:hypothetical protein F4604DRAFT_1932931 [Suillus subluteus]|nr:hypothetical protein F4604DRAFT_1932931 [Suillus subluteus]
MSQHSLTAEELTDAFILLGTWKREFETLYYQLREDRLHFVPPCTHQTSHLVTETVQKGPPICYAQWTMEHTIGNLGQEIRQPSRPYANLSRQVLRRSMINTLLSTMPDLDEPRKHLSDTATDLGDGYALLRKRDRYAKLPVGEEAQSLSDFLGPNHPLPRVKKWSLTSITKWSNCTLCLEGEANATRQDTNVSQTEFAEVLYYTILAFAEPDADDSDDEAGYHFLNVAVIQFVSCSLLDEISVIDVKKIISVVAMIPHKPRLPSGIIEDRFFMLEKPELDIANFGASHENLGDDAEDDEDADIE